LVRRASTFATIFVAVGYYLQDDFSKAETYFKTALSRAHGQPVEPLLLLFLGNIANQRHQPHRAARYYTGALRLAPGYGRARFGLAEVQYALGKHDCSPRDVDAPMLRRARAAFGKVPLADLRLDSARAALVLAAKVQFGVAQVDLCLSHAEVTSRWQQARRGFRAVIRAYASRRSELRDDAAEAHAGLGLSYLVLRTRSGYRVAQREYRAAAETTTIDQRAAYFYRMLGYADRLLGDPAGVRDARRRSDLLTP
jgi:tetratricopeptide (TPR) repeat protein